MNGAMHDGLHVGAELRALRHDAGLSLREAAKRAGVNPFYMCRVERGRERPSRDWLERVCRSLDVPPDTLLHLLGRLPSDVEEVLLTHPAAVDWVRAAAGWSEEEWQRRLRLDWGRT